MMGIFKLFLKKPKKLATPSRSANLTHNLQFIESEPFKSNQPGIYIPASVRPKSSNLSGTIPKPQVSTKT